MSQAYDFKNDQKWKELAKKIDPSISDERLEYLRNYWDKENINHKHDVEINKISDVKEESKLPYYIYSTENIFKMSFMLLLFMHGVTQVFGYLFNFLALQRQIRNSQTQQKKKYIQLLIKNEFFHNLIFLFLFHFFDRMHNIIIYGPIIMHAWVGTSEFIFLHHKGIYERMQNFIDKTKQNKELILIQKQKAEVLILPTLVFGKLFFDYGNWVLIILYVVFLKLKFHINSRSKVAWIQIDFLIESHIPTNYQTIYRKIRNVFQEFVLG